MSKLNSIKKRIDDLSNKLRYHNWRYYTLSEPDISDKEYDDLLKELKQLEIQYPILIKPDSPTQRISGEVLKGFSTVEHKVKMFSLNNTYSEEEVWDWEKKLKRMLGREIKLNYMAELKIDGVSC